MIKKDRVKKSLILRLDAIYAKYQTQQIKEKIDAIKKLIEQIEALKTIEEK